MATIQEICQLIKSQQQMVYEYQVEGRAVGKRYGNPHIIWETKNGYIHVHIWKTGGVSTDPSQMLPDWRTYRLENLVLVSYGGNFSLADGYKPESTRYFRTICAA